MRFILFAVLNFVFVTASVAQNDYDLMGALFLDEARPISYRLIFEENNGKINGYSLTGIGTNFETKSEISGKFEGDSLFLNEFQVLSTVSEEPISNFCFIACVACSCCFCNGNRRSFCFCSNIYNSSKYPDNNSLNYGYAIK